MSSIVEIENVSKSYKKQQVLSNLSWSIQRGDIIGLLGRNGAGKSTLLKGILNLIEIDAGKITIFGELNTELSAENLAKIGYVPQQSDEITWLTVAELIAYRKQFYTHWNQPKVTALLERWQLDENKEVGELSPGQLQRLLIVLALAHDPELLVLDEPASALDPAARRDFLKELIELASDNQITIIFSTHITSDLERVANKVAILHLGNIRYFDELDNAKENVVRLTLNNTEITESDIPHLVRATKTSKTLECIVSQLNQTWLREQQAQGCDISISSMGLEDMFLELTA